MTHFLSSLFLFGCLFVASKSGLADCESEALTRSVQQIWVGLLDQQSSFDEISEVYQSMVRSGTNLGKTDVELQRFVGISDWEKAFEESGVKSSKRVYGSRASANWVKAMRFLQKRSSDLEVTPDLLREVHQIAFDGLPFHGFEGRRIRERFDRGEISKEEFKALLEKAFKQNEEVSGVDHSSLLGRFRDSPKDEITHSGSSFDKDGSRYFTDSELAAMRSNPYIRVDEDSIESLEPNKNRGKSFYVSPSAIDRSVKEILAKSNREISEAKSKREISQAIAAMERNLISVHPFLDGNGRTVRLIGDMLRQRHGLPPPLHPNESDLVQSSKENLRWQKSSMLEYLKAAANAKPK